MRKFGLAVLLGSVFLIAGCAHIPHEEQIHTRLSSANEVPPNASVLKGDFVLQLKDKEYYVEVGNIVDPTHRPRAAHFHCAKSGSNGGVVYGIAAGENDWGQHNKLYATYGKIDNAKFSPNVPSPTCPTVINSYESLLKAIDDGYIYVNVHTQAYPGGEIRGQVLFKK
jgi:CHRD domain